MKGEQEEFKFAGIPTFMRSPYVSTDELDPYDVGVLGVPVDHGVSYRAGAKDAPRWIREHSHWDRVEGLDYVDLDDSATPLQPHTLQIADVGDVHIHPGDAEATNRAIEAAVREVRRSSFPLVLGGDHSITYASVKGCAGAVEASRDDIGILHFDAHTDVETSYLTLPRVWHGNPFRMLIEDRIIHGSNLVTIGPRGLLPAKWMDFIKQEGINLFTMQEVVKEGLDSVIDRAIGLLRERCAKVYLTFDIDCIDPCDAPGTGTPSSGGIRAHEINRVMRQLGEVPLIGFDLTEVNPHFDPSGRTAIIACDLLWNFLSFSLKKT